MKSSKTKNLSDLLAKNLTWLSSAKIQRSVTAHPRKSLISRNLDSHFHPGNGVLNSFAFSEKGNPTPNGFLIERKAGVSFAKRKVILPKIVLSNLTRQSNLFNTSNLLQNFPQPQIKLNTCFLNKKNQMMIWSLSYQHNSVIQTVLILNLSTQFNLPPFLFMTIPYPYLLLKSKLSLSNIINLSPPLVLLTLVLNELCLILLFFLLSIGNLKTNTSKQQMERSLQLN